MFSLNSIGCVTKCGPAGILGGNTADQMYMGQRAQIFIQKDLNNISPLDEEQARWAANE